MNEEITPGNASQDTCDCGMCDKCMTKAACTPDNPCGNCEKCMTKGCTPDSPDCNDPMCKACMNKSIDIWDGTGFGKRNFNSKQRQHMAQTGAAMPDGSFPIANAKDLANAIRLYGHAANPDAAKAHIKRRAAALGLTDALPEDWKK